MTLKEIKQFDPRNKITIVGAGPGDPDLITIRGLRAIKNADVLLYDALVHPNLVAEAPSHCLKIFVGKRANHHFASQEEINENLVDFVKMGHVVRLKGGDPFVFGRGFEELKYAERTGAPVEIIPGLSSVTAVSTWNGLPVTLRDVSKSFHVVTAVGKDGKLTKALQQVVQLEGTAVVLMGLRKLKEIVGLYQYHGKGSGGIAVIQNGTLAHQKVVIGHIDNICHKVAEAKVSTPAIMYIGEVVNIHQEHQKTINYGTEKSVVSGIFQA